MKVFKDIIGVAIIAGVDAVFGAKGAEVSLTPVNPPIRSVIGMFQDQKAAIIADQKELQRSCAKKARDEVRDLVTCSKSTSITALRQEIKQSVENAKRQAIEQQRKLGVEIAALARESRRAAL